MKKALPVLVVVAVLAAAVVFFLKRKTDDAALDLQPGRAAELAPANALFFAEAPNIPRSLERWKGTAIYAITQEPEWKEFTSKWDDFKTASEMARDVFGVLAEIEKADPSGMWIAMTAVEPMPKAIAGFPYRGKKSDVESVVRKLKDELTKMRPGVKSEMTSFDGTQIEVLTDTAFTAVMAFQDNWFFLGSDLDLLRETLSRYGAKPDAKPALKTNVLYQETLKQASAESDFSVWVDGTIFPDAARKEFPPFAMVKALLYTAKIEGRIVRERGYLHTGAATISKPIANRSIGLTQPATYAYAVGDTEVLEKLTKAIFESALGVASNPQSQIDAALAPKGLKFADIFTTFGPELSVTSAWERGWMFPDVLAAVEVRDKTKGRLFAELIATSMGSEGKLTLKEVDGSATWTLEVGGPIQPTLGVNDRHMMIGLNDGTVRTALKQLSSAAPNVATKPDANFPAALKGVAAPTVGMLYVDLQPLFEKLWDRVKPFIAMQLVGEAEASKYFDSAKLPSATTISKHLHPLIVTLSSAEQGWLMESTGPFGGIFGLQTIGLGGGFFWAVPVRQAFPPAPAQAAPPTAIPGNP
jgi:hypothetical protein